MTLKNQECILQKRQRLNLIFGPSSQWFYCKMYFIDINAGRDGPCLDIAQPDIAASGGISEFMKISALGKYYVRHKTFV